MDTPGQTEFLPVKIAEIELTAPAADLEGLGGYREVRALVRLHGSNLGMVTVPVTAGRCAASSLKRHAITQLRPEVLRHLVVDMLAEGISEPDIALDRLTSVGHEPPPSVTPSLTVAVCTRDRTTDLSRCLAALTLLDPPPDEIIVVDNAPRTGATEDLVATYPAVRYVRELMPGLDRARNRAIVEASGDVVAFTDDDVAVDRAWVGAIKRAFGTHSDVAAVVGLVLPLEIETEAQELFERYGGFGRGFERGWYRVGPGQSAAALYAGTGRFGTGANMAFRRSVLHEVGLFDPALDVGTITNGGGDLEMFYRVLANGRVLMYEPDALVWHRHRRDYATLREQITNNGIGFYSYLTAGALTRPADRWHFVRFGAWWFAWWSLRRLLITYYKPGALPRDLVLAELVGSIRGLFRYQRARRLAGDLAPTTAPGADRPYPVEGRGPANPAADLAAPLPMQTVDISKPVRNLARTSGCARVHLVVLRSGRLLGTATIDNQYRAVSADEARRAIAEKVNVFETELEPDQPDEDTTAAERVVARLAPAGDERPSLPADVDVSIVLATFDRPDDLRRALSSLRETHTRRRIEIVVVDNHPASNLTPPVVGAFDNVRLIAEPRHGLSYARNAGIAASSGRIVVTTDDDVVAPPDWLEKLIAPFVDDNVMAVTGNVLPLELTTRAQRLFEAYGGLGRGLTPRMFDGAWFWACRQAVPTWILGGTANAAFRATIFEHPSIGLFDEALGAGTPAGCSEDTDLFYRVLRSGFRLVYEPQAYVWHRHRSSMRELRHQVYSYAKGQVAYQLTTLTRFRDLRALRRLLLELPDLYSWRIVQRLRRRSAYPLSLIAIEVAGTLIGPVAFWRSRRRVKRLGRSAPYSAASRGAEHRSPAPRSVMVQ